MSRNNRDFDNGSFWDRRYIENPSLGSGVGSRGQNLVHKRKIIESFLHATAPESILDVGCGDHEVLKDIVDLPGYIGVDVSVVAVENNKTQFPYRRFECMDFVFCTDVTNLRSDVTLCLEVLIHQHTWEAYCKLVRNLVDATAGNGLISGYTTDPRPAIASEIIAWHEPITETLRHAGASSVTIEAKSLESDSLAFVSFKT